MPGKVNPVVPEVVNQVAFAVAGADVTVTMAAEAGQLQLNAFEPIMANSLFDCLEWLTAAVRTLRVNCIDGIEANEERLSDQMERFVGVITALVPHVGYANAAKLAKIALAEQRNIAELVVEHGMLTREQVERLMTPASLTTNTTRVEP
jgi:aspartate ammonia-lyase